VRLTVAVTVTAAAGWTTIATPARALTVPKVNATVASVATQLSWPVTGIAATPTGKGFWRVAADGKVLTTGDAPYYGNAIAAHRDVVIGIAATPTGKGYWLVDRSGGIYRFGDAPYRGSMSGKPLTKPIVGMASTPNGQGYWLVASDGGIFTFNAPYRGSTGAMRLNKPIVGMAAVADAYTLVASDGGLFRFGNSPFYGSAVDACPGGPAVALAMSKGAVGYWIAFSDARTYAFSPSTTPPKCTSRPYLMAKDLHTRANAERAARGIGGMSWDQGLANYAANWAKVMSTKGLVHSNIGTLVGSSAPYIYIGENIAIGGPKSPSGQMHVAWMNSVGHRANLLDRGFTQMGAGVFCGPTGTYLVEVFGRFKSQGSPPARPPTPPVNPIVRPDLGIAC
jgi:uncharacterized protein YkwD